jgi:hypothetical protein
MVSLYAIIDEMSVVRQHHYSRDRLKKQQLLEELNMKHQP